MRGAPINWVDSHDGFHARLRTAIAAAASAATLALGAGAASAASVTIDFGTGPTVVGVTSPYIEDGFEIAGNVTRSVRYRHNPPGSITLDNVRTPTDTDRARAAAKFSLVSFDQRCTSDIEACGFSVGTTSITSGSDVHLELSASRCPALRALPASPRSSSPEPTGSTSSTTSSSPTRTTSRPFPVPAAPAAPAGRDRRPRTDGAAQAQGSLTPGRPDPRLHLGPNTPAGGKLERPQGRDPGSQSRAAGAPTSLARGQRASTSRACQGARAQPRPAATRPRARRTVGATGSLRRRVDRLGRMNPHHPPPAQHEELPPPPHRPDRGRLRIAGKPRPPALGQVQPAGLRLASIQTSGMFAKGRAASNPAIWPPTSPWVPRNHTCSSAPPTPRAGSRAPAHRPPASRGAPAHGTPAARSAQAHGCGTRAAPR